MANTWIVCIDGTWNQPGQRDKDPLTATEEAAPSNVVRTWQALANRSLATILFTDIVGSTELIQDRDPEEAQRLLDGVVQIMMDAVHRYEGYVDKYIGDAIMALFGGAFAVTTIMERKGLGRFQNRYGPNRVGPFGLLQPIADAIKMLTKEDIVPFSADKVVHYLAPLVLCVPVWLTFSVLPFGRNMAAIDLDAGAALRAFFHRGGQLFLQPIGDIGFALQARAAGGATAEREDDARVAEHLMRAPPCGDPAVVASLRRAADAARRLEPVAGQEVLPVVEEPDVHHPRHRPRPPVEERGVHRRREVLGALGGRPALREVEQPPGARELRHPDDVEHEHVEAGAPPLQVHHVELVLDVGRPRQGLVGHGDAGMAPLELAEQRAERVGAAPRHPGMPEDEPRIATYKAKWDEAYRKRWGIRNDFAGKLDKDLEERLADVCKRAYRALNIRSYARFDLENTACRSELPSHWRAPACPRAAARDRSHRVRAAPRQAQPPPNPSPARRPGH